MAAAVAASAEPSDDGESSSSPHSKSMLSYLRQQFLTMSAGKRKAHAADLARYWVGNAQARRAHVGRGPLTRLEQQAICLRVVQLFQEMTMSGEDEIGMEEWVHCLMMMQSGLVGKQVDSLLGKAMVASPTILQDLQDLFETADDTQKGELTFTQVSAMYNKKIWKFRPGQNARPLLDEELDEPGAPEKYARELMKLMDVEGQEKIGYSAFMAYCLGRRKQAVILNLYDLSKGMATALSEFVVGEELEGIWHTGVVCFGKEYYYGRDTMIDEPNATIFGTPSRSIELGYTMWRQQELHAFVVHELKPIFHRGTYDVVTNNCNHFTDRVSMFLLGRHVPDEVMRQPKLLLKSKFVRIVRPLMNYWLRERVARRDPGKDLPPGIPRLKVEDRPPMGTIVDVHPLETGTGMPVVALVLGAAKSGSEAKGQTTNWFPLLDMCSSNIDTERHEGSFCTSCGTDRFRRLGSSRSGCEILVCVSCGQDRLEKGVRAGTGERDCGIWVQYFDVRLGKVSKSIAAAVRTELVPRWRLSLSEMNETVLPLYIAVMKGIGLSCTQFPADEIRDFPEPESPTSKKASPEKPEPPDRTETDLAFLEDDTIVASI